jgi:hypothetical protein
VLISVAGRPDSLHPVLAALHSLARSLQKFVASARTGSGPVKKALHAAGAVNGSAQLLDSVQVEGQFSLVRKLLTLVGGLLPLVGGPVAFVGTLVSAIRGAFALKQAAFPLVGLVPPVPAARVVLRHQTMVRPRLRRN